MGMVMVLHTRHACASMGMDQLLNNWGPSADLDKPYLQPNIRERILVAQGMDANNNLLTMSTSDVIRAGPVASHAEFRSLNDLACEKFGNTYIEPKVFDEWLKNDVIGYVRKIKPDKFQNVVQHTCVHCYYFTDLVTFIRVD